MSASRDDGLAALQRRFQAYLLGENRAFAEDVLEQTGTPAEARLEIYAEAYNLRLIEALQADFGALYTVLGEQQFSDLARAYIAAHPSTHPSIRWFGRGLADFLAQTRPWSELQYLAELARFEWALSICFDATDATPVVVEEMADVPVDSWPGLTFGFLPSVQRVDLRYDVAAVRSAVDADQPLDLPPTTSEYPVGWVIWRPELISNYRSMSVDEAVSLDSAIAGADFASICEGLCEWLDPENAPGHAAYLLKGWLSEGLIAEIRL